MSTIEFRLRRSNPGISWGFRLQGGRDVNAPLTVQRVFNGSPADGNLQRGDVLLSINNNDVSSAFLKNAEELVKASADTLIVIVRRTGQPVNRSEINDIPIQQSANRTSQFEPTHQASSFATSAPGGGFVPSRAPQSQQPANVWRPNSFFGPADSYGAPSDGFQQNNVGGQSNGYQPVKVPWSTENYGDQSQQQYQSRTWSPPVNDTRGQHHHSGQQEDQMYPPFTHTTPSNQQNFGAIQAPPGDEYQPTQQDDEETYEQKSVRDIKQMFNKPSKPLAFGPESKSPTSSVSSRPQNLWHQDYRNSPPRSSSGTSMRPLSISQHSQSMSHPVQQQPSWMSPPGTANRSFASPPVSSPTSYPYGASDPYYPPPKKETTPVSVGRLSMIKKPEPRPGAGYSYQGIVTASPVKTVHGKSSSVGARSQPGKKKEFDPSQSLVYQMLQEESQRGGQQDNDQESSQRQRAGGRSQQQQPQWAGQQQQQQQGQRSARLQQLLERDQAEAQQQNDAAPMSPQGGAGGYPSSARTRREMSPSYPQPSSRRQRHQQQQQPGAGSYQQPQQQQYGAGYQQQQYGQYPAGGAGDYYQQQAFGAGGYDDIPISDF
jgi:hypothetical protein